MDCPHETLVVSAVLSGAWPHRCDAALVGHASSCDTCREVASVAVLLREEVEYARLEVPVPAAGQVWWRAAVRARLESTHAATRPMTWLHGITAAMVIGVVLAAVTALWPRLPAVINAARAMATNYAPGAEATAAIVGSLRMSVMLGLVAAAFMILAPLAIYFALSDD